MIRSLNLDPMFIPVPAPEIELELLQFSGGEWHIKLSDGVDYSKVEKVIITNRFSDMNDLMRVAIAKDALKQRGVTACDLVIPYMPYSRQDRVFEGGAFTLKVFANLLNSLEFEKVITLDAHSDVTPAIINNCTSISNSIYVHMAASNISGDVLLVSPDAGSNKKCTKLFGSLPCFKGLVKCDKVRNEQTGELLDFEVFTSDLHGKDCLIVDDICDGGGTFMGLYQKLLDKGAGDIYLFVTHGIFSKGLWELGEYFTKIYCTNSIKDIEEESVKQFQIQL